MPRAARPQVAPALISRVDAICSAWPGVVQENAWAGVRWCVRQRNFAHLATIVDGWPPAYVQAAGTAGPATVLTFRALPSLLGSGRLGCAPYLKPVWFQDIAGLVIDTDTEWDEVAGLLRDSWRLNAPGKLLALVDG
jgi:hypothetical protein